MKYINGIEGDYYTLFELNKDISDVEKNHKDVFLTEIKLFESHKEIELPEVEFNSEQFEQDDKVWQSKFRRLSENFTVLYNSLNSNIRSNYQFELTKAECEKARLALQEHQKVRPYKTEPKYNTHKRTTISLSGTEALKIIKSVITQRFITGQDEFELAIEDDIMDTRKSLANKYTEDEWKFLFFLKKYSSSISIGYPGASLKGGKGWLEFDDKLKNFPKGYPTKEEYLSASIESLKDSYINYKSNRENIEQAENELIKKCTLSPKEKEAATAIRVCLNNTRDIEHKQKYIDSLKANCL